MAKQLPSFYRIAAKKNGAIRVVFNGLIKKPEN
jgi:hypothetical protein